MDIEEIESKIVEQLGNIVEADARIVEIDRHTGMLQNNILEMGGYYKLKTAMDRAEYNNEIRRELEFVGRRRKDAVNTSNDAYRLAASLVPRVLRNIDLGFDVDDNRFHVKVYDNGSAAITYRRIEE